MGADLVLICLERDDSALARLGERFPSRDIRIFPPLKSGDSLPGDLARNVEILVSGWLPANFQELERLKWIQLSSAGYSEVFGLPIVERGICVTNALGVFDVPVAEWNIMMILNLHRHLSEMVENQHSRVWQRDSRFQAELRGAVLGLYGYGGIARETARLAKALGLTVWVMTRDGQLKPRRDKYRVEGTGDPEGTLPDRVFAPRQIEEFLSGVDFLCVAVPLTRATRGLVGEKELRMLKSSAVLINAARAAIVDEDALVRALREKWIRGAALDAHYREPLPPTHPLWTMPNLVLTPHISGSDKSTHYLDRLYDLFLQNLERYAGGKPLLNALIESQLRGE